VAVHPLASDQYVGCKNDDAVCYPASAGAVQLKNLTVTGCDLKVFLVWIGTDASGQYLRSANNRFSVYRKYGVSSLYQSAREAQGARGGASCFAPFLSAHPLLLISLSLSPLS
jgi:hypothetical protein